MRAQPALNWHTHTLAVASVDKGSGVSELGAAQLRQEIAVRVAVCCMGSRQRGGNGWV